MNLFYYIIENLYTLFFIITRIATLFQYNFLIASTLNSNNRNSYISIDQRAAMPSSYLLYYTYFPLPSAQFCFASSRCMLSPITSIKKYNIRLISRMSTHKKRTNRFMQAWRLILSCVTSASQMLYLLMSCLARYHSNSSLPSCFMVFFIGLDGGNQEVLSDFYLLCGFSRDYIVILLSLTISIKAFMAILKISSHNSLNRMVISKLL